ncbi:MAG: glycosyltransferase [Nitrospiraceae bacterium]|nr:glycosyltransferase [Nitrospiraceae bacterium]
MIIACLNVADTIAEQLEALAAQQWGETWEVIVADNGCTDETVRIVKQYSECLPNLRIVDAAARRGKSFALNTAARAARGESLVFCDADDEVAPGWVAAMGRALSQHEFVACRMDIEKLNSLWVRKTHRNPQSDGIQQYTYPRYLPHAGGSTIGVKRRLHEEVGGFDETMIRLQDTDYCWRIQLKGVALHFVPDAVIHVRFRTDLRGIFRQARGCGEYNAKICSKYRPLGMPKASLTAGILSWLYLPKHFFRIRNKGDVADFAWQIGYRMGRLKGSIKYGVIAL